MYVLAPTPKRQAHNSFSYASLHQRLNVVARDKQDQTNHRAACLLHYTHDYTHTVPKDKGCPVHATDNND